MSDNYSITNNQLNQPNQLNDGINVAGEHVNNYPPHNVLTISDEINSLMIATPGFSEDDIKVSTSLSSDGYVELTVKGEAPDDIHTTRNINKKKYTFIGFEVKEFSKVFKLRPFTRVNHISVVSGILIIELEIFKPEGLGEISFNQDRNALQTKVTQL